MRCMLPWTRAPDSPSARRGPLLCPRRLPLQHGTAVQVLQVLLTGHEGAQSWCRGVPVPPSLDQAGRYLQLPSGSGVMCQPRSRGDGVMAGRDPRQVISPLEPWDRPKPSSLPAQNILRMRAALGLPRADSNGAPCFDRTCRRGFLLPFDLLQQDCGDGEEGAGCPSGREGDGHSRQALCTLASLLSVSSQQHPRAAGGDCFESSFLPP